MSSHSFSDPVTDSIASAASASARTASAHISTRRRSWRSETAPPMSRQTIVGIVIAMPTLARAVGALDNAYTCQASATRNMPSPSSETLIPPTNRR